jgi:DNA-binding SARP family transcriptional activator
MDFRILGPLEVENGGRAVELGGARQRALLAILLVRRGEVVSADHLIEGLYGSRPPATATKSLQAHVSRLRKALGADERLKTQSGGYMLELADDELDAERFSRLLDQGRSSLAAGDAEAAAKTLEQALALWRGTALADLGYEEFAQTEIARLEELRLAASEELHDAYLQLGRHAELVGDLERTVREHPLRERPRGQLMLALYRCGRQAEALGVYHDGRRALVEELGLEPSRALQELERAILNQDPRLDPHVEPSSTNRRTVRAGRVATGVFVGRQRELSQLEAALIDARAGRGGLVLLSGEAGIGKSRLADELGADATAAGVRVLWGRCWEAGGAPAYWPWVQALRTYVRDCDAATLREHLGRGAAEVAHLLPELRDLLPDLPEPPPLDSEGARFGLFDSTAAFIRRVAANEPLLVVLDDVHAADAPSLLLLEFVATELADARVLVVAAYRDPELDRGDPIAVALADVARRASLRVSLSGLGEPEVASYIELSSDVLPPPSLVTAIAAETEGNPLFVGEVVRLLAADGRLARPADSSWRPAIPETVKEVIGRRLTRLSPDCGDVLAVASVVGREFPIELVERVARRSRADVLTLLDEAGSARLVTDVPGSLGRLRFTHALVRDTLYDGLAHARRLELHRATGDAIALHGVDESRLSELAHHFFNALPAIEPQVAVEHARRAGDHAMTVLAHEEAARLYETALQALQLDPELLKREERGLLLARGEALARAGDLAGAKDAFLRAAALARTAASAEDLATAALGYGGRTVWSRRGGDRIIVALLEEALAGLGAADTPLRARVLARLAGALRDDRDPAPRVTIGKRAVATARRTGDRAALTYALRGLCAAQHAIGDHETRLEVAAELHDIAHREGDKEAECEAISAEMLVHAERNEFDAVREHATRFIAIADDLRQPSQRWFGAAVRALLALHEGRLTDAEILLEDAYALGTRSEPVLAAAAYAIQLFQIRREQARTEEAYAPLARVASERPERPFFRCALAALAADADRVAEARRIFEELAPNAFEVVPRDNEWLLSAAFLVDTCEALGDLTRAEALSNELAPLADRSTANVPEGVAGAVARYLGILAAMLGREDDAVAHYRAAIAIDVATGAPGWAAYAKAELAAILRRRGDVEEATLLRDEARTTAAEFGMIRLAGRIDSASP